MADIFFSKSVFTQIFSKFSREVSYHFIVEKRLSKIEFCVSEVQIL